MQDVVAISETEDEVVEILAKSHLFRRMRDSDRAQLAHHFKEIKFDEGQVIYEQTAPADNFYFIKQGSVQLQRTVDDQVQVIANLVAGDYFGLDTLMIDQTRSHVALALEPVVLFFIRAEPLFDLIERIPRVKLAFSMAIKAFQSMRHLEFKWLEKGETVYLITRKHGMVLFFHLLPSSLLLLLALPIFWLAAVSQMEMLILVGWVMIAAGLLWGVWNIIDWANDFYFVTNKRVVWLERVVGLYDSRQEAPIHLVRSVDYTTTFFSRFLKYGNLAVNTITSTIILRHIPYPQQVADLIEEHIGRSGKKQSMATEEFKVKTLREHVGIEKTPARRAEDEESPTLAEVKRQRWTTSLRMRIVGGDIVTYRKHWLVLLIKLAGPLALLLFSLGILVAKWLGFGPISLLSLPTVLVFGSVFGLSAILWLIYQYFDWQNDIYRITPDQILDLERKPLGDEYRKVASLENILSLEVRKKGILNILFNFGDVVADVSGTPFIFRNIYDPASAQLEIAKRMDALRRKKQEAEYLADTQRIMDVVALYHREVQRPTR